MVLHRLIQQRNTRRVGRLFSGPPGSGIAKTTMLFDVTYVFDIV